MATTGRRFSPRRLATLILAVTFVGDLVLSIPVAERNTGALSDGRYPPNGRRVQRSTFSTGTLHIGKPSSTRGECDSFDRPRDPNTGREYCKFIDKASFPNIRGHETAAEAISEFDDFFPLLGSNTTGPCHPKLEILLCFIYFPFCTPNYPNIRYYPCRETCEEVHESNCTDYVQASGARGWAEHLQCNATRKISEDVTVPVYLNAVLNPDGNVGNCIYGGELEEEVTKAPPGCDEQCNDKCDYRNGTNGGTFKRNCYNYAVRVNVSSVSTVNCKTVYGATVIEQFNLKTPVGPNNLTLAPTLDKNQVITIDTGLCNKCTRAELNNEYLIAGYYHVSDGGKVYWELGLPNSRGLFTQWNTKLDKKLKKWVNSANAVRAKNKFLNDCQNMLS